MSDEINPLPAEPLVTVAPPVVSLHVIPEEVVANADALIEQANIEMGRVPPPGAEIKEQKE